MKKIVTLLLALVMLVSVLALPTLAATAEESHVCNHEIQPRLPATYCSCGGYAPCTGYMDPDVRIAEFQCDSCGKIFMAHY